MTDDAHESFGQRLFRLISNTPQMPSRGERRILIVGRIATPLGMVFHAFFIFTFWRAGVWPMSVFNVASTILWIMATFIYWLPSWFTIYRYRVMFFATAMIEIPVHALLATYLVGSEPGFYLFLITAMIVSTFVTFVPTTLRLLAMALYGLLFAGCAYFGQQFDAPFKLSHEFETYALIINSLGSMLISIVLLFLYVFVAQDAEARLQRAHDRAESLLLNILPREIADRLKETNDIIADEFPEATILFADIVNFTESSSKLRPRDIVYRLNLVFSAFDEIASKYGVEKIKTIGDAYMVVAGLPEPRQDHAITMVRMAQDMLQAVGRINVTIGGDPIHIRIGLNSGPVVAGVIGRSKFAYDLWGDAVNVAARMEQGSAPGEMRITENTLSLLNGQFATEDRGMVEVKGKGQMRTFAIKGNIATGT